MLRLLFIDDDDLALQLMAKVSHLLGYQAILSTSARNGLVLAALENPAVIFVDMQMDEMDGMEFTRLVRSQPALCHLPVLVLSAGMGNGDEEKALQAGASGFIHKPMGLTELSEAIQKYTHLS